MRHDPMSQCQPRLQSARASNFQIRRDLARSQHTRILIVLVSACEGVLHPTSRCSTVSVAQSIVDFHWASARWLDSSMEYWKRGRGEGSSVYAGPGRPRRSVGSRGAGMEREMVPAAVNIHIHISGGKRKIDTWISCFYIGLYLNRYWWARDDVIDVQD